MKVQFLEAIALSLLPFVSATTPADGYIKEHNIPFDLNGSNFTYPWPVKIFQFLSQRAQTLEMAFMDVKPSVPANNKTVVLFHGRNFCGATWQATASVLLKSGYRVILPDQVGFCKSTKPDRYQFSLQQLAANTNKLLLKLGIQKATFIGHSMGGMLATRYGLMYPANVTDIVLVNPIGLEDWKALGVPYQDTDITFAQEKSSSYASIKAYEQATYYVGTWAPSYDVWVNMLLGVYTGSKAAAYAWNQALVVDMVLSQPVYYEFPILKPKTLLVIGTKDNTAIGKQWSPPEVAAKLGHYDVLGKQVAALIPNSTLIEFEDLGHAPQIQAPDRFHTALLGWLSAH